MKRKNLILLIGVAAVVGLYYYKKMKENQNKLSGDPKNTQAVTPPMVDAIPRTEIKKDYRIVMPADLVSQNVRRKGRELSDRRMSVDTSKLV